MSIPTGYPAATLAQYGVGKEQPKQIEPREFLPPPPDGFKRTISLCMIARGDEEGLKAAIDSCYDYVDEIILGLNGPAKLTLAWVPTYPKIKTHRFKWRDDFAAARNETFKRATCDWLFWIDSDDTVENPQQLQAAIYNAEQRGVGSIQLTYVFRSDENGNPMVVHSRERLLKRDLRWSWKDRVHEYANSEVVHRLAFIDDIRIIHHSVGDHTDRNLRLLKLMEAEDPNYSRMLWEMGDCYYSLEDYDTAFKYYTRYFDNAESSIRQWAAATSAASAAMRAAFETQNGIWWSEVTRWAQVAITVHPEFKDPYIFLAHAAWWDNQDSFRAMVWLDSAENKQEAPLEVMRHPYIYTINRWDVEHRALADQGKWKDALEVISQALVETNWDEKWQYYAYLYMEADECDKSIIAATQLVNHLCKRGDTLRALKLLEECVPLSIKQDKRYLRLVKQIRDFTAHVFDPEKYVDFYVSNHDGEHGEMNGTDVNLYRMEALDVALKARGAKRILDVACGAGGPAMWLAEQGYEVVGLDINAAEIDFANEQAKDVPNLSFICGSLDNFNADNKFDAVVMMELIEHLNPKDVPFFMASATDYLLPGGSVFITTPNMLVGDIPGIDQYFPRDHVTEFSYEDLLLLVMAHPGWRLWNLHKISEPAARVPGFGSWFLEYDNEGEAETPQPVVIYVGQGFEYWTPDMPAKVGLGGSETWAVEMAKQFRRQGHPVVVYAECEGVYDGVIYRHYNKFTPAGSALGVNPWLLIVSRRADLFDQDLQAAHLAFMAHDVDYGQEVTPERFSNVKYFVLSEWHKAHTQEVYPWLKDIGVTSNGVRLEYFDGPSPGRKLHSFIWSSSPDRGLDRLLEMWPQIREVTPDATLDIFYGWNNIDRAMSSRPYLREFKQQIEELCRQPGVTWKGRVGQKQLAEEFRKHEYWVYFSETPFENLHFNETYCISALEAQVGGCVCLVNPYGALPERCISSNFYIAEPEITLDAVLEVVSRGHKEPEFTHEPTTWEIAAREFLTHFADVTIGAE